MKRSIVSILLVVSLILVSACGSNSNNSSTSSSSSAPSSSSASSAASESGLDKVQKRGKLVVATSGNGKPFTYLDEKGNLVGFDIDLANLIADELGVELELKTGQFSGFIPALLNGEFDAIISALNVTEERKQSIDYTEPYFADGYVAIVKEGDDSVKDINGIAGKVVGVTTGTAYVKVAENIGGYKELKEYPGNAEGFADLVSGRVDVIINNSRIANEFIATNPGKAKVVGDVVKGTDVAIGMQKNNEELRDKISEIIKTIKADGTLNDLSMKWFNSPLPF